MESHLHINERVKAKKPIDPIGSLASHWLKIMVFGTILFILIAPMGLSLSKPFYDSIGKLRIAPVLPTLISRADEASIISYYSDYVLTQVDRIYELAVLEQALERLEPEQKSVFIPEGMSISHASSILGNRLEVGQVPETHLVQIYLSGEKPDGLAEIINNVIDVFIEKLRDEEEGKDNRRLTYLRQEKERIESDIATMTALLQEITLKTGTSTIHQAQNMHTHQLEALQRAYTDVYGRRVEKESQYKKALQQEEALKELSLMPVVNEMVHNNASLMETKTWTYKQFHEMESSLAGVTLDNPDRLFKDRRIKEMDDYLEQLRNDFRSDSIEILNAKRGFELGQRIINAKSDYDAASRAEQEIKKELDRVKKAASEAAQLIFQGHQVSETLRQRRDLLDRLNERIHEIKLESRAPGRVILESRAKIPEQPSGENKVKYLIITFMLSFISVIAVTVMSDSLDNRITSVKDVVNAIGFTPSWPISNYLVTGDGRVPFHRVAMDDPQNVVSKAIRSLVVRLNREREEHDAKVVIFTGVDSESGTTSISINAAHSMRRFCKKVLIIEANFVSPGIRRLYSYDMTKPSLVDILKGEASLEECIHHDHERGIDIVTGNRIPTSEEEADLDNLLLIAMLIKARSEYDFIFIDSAPVMRSDLTEFLVVQADIGALIIQGDRSLYKNLRRSVQIMSRLRLTSISAVLNWGAPRYMTKFQKFGSMVVSPIEKRLPDYLKRIG